MRELAMVLVVWAAGDANKVNPISGNILEEHYWQSGGRSPYNFSPSYQGERAGTLREKSSVWDAATKRISLRAAGNEFVAFQVLVEKPADGNLNKYYKLANAARYSVKVNPEDTYRMRYETFDAIQSAGK
ncbi:MAG TPA: hypothetical protein VFJ30_05845 [Phycisphaerae bacterium]|nr:hypothetical protein [Phycisphaerae bacterium]